MELFFQFSPCHPFRLVFPQFTNGIDFRDGIREKPFSLSRNVEFLL
jgi:hypothetical protein